MLDVLIHTSDTFYLDPAHAKFDVAYDRVSSMKQGYIQRVMPTGHKWGRLELDPKRFLIIQIEDHWLQSEWLDIQFDQDIEICDRRFRFPLKKLLTAGELSALTSIPYNDLTVRPPIIKSVDLRTIVELNNWDKQPKIIKLHGSAGDFSIQEDGGGDYTSLKTAVETEAGDISGGAVDANFYITETWASADTGNWDIDGWTMGSNNMLIQTQGDSRSTNGKWRSDGWRISDATEGIDIEAANVTIDGAQIVATSTGRCMVISAGATASKVEYCILDGGSSSGGGVAYLTALTGSTHTLENCVIYRVKAVETVSEGVFINTTDGTVNMTNCTISGWNDGVEEGISGDINCSNCAVFNDDDDFDLDATGGTIDHCASDDGDGTNAVDISPGGTEADDWANAFTDWSNGDFSIKNTSSVLYNAGTNTGAPSNDIMGTSRPQATTVDIGAFEFIVAAGGGALPSRVLTGPFEGPFGGPL